MKCSPVPARRALAPLGRYSALRMIGKLLRKHCQLDEAGERILRQAMTELGLSARAHDKILRVARTIADLSNQTTVLSEHVLEAIQYRRLDRQL